MKVRKLHTSEWPSFFEWSDSKGSLFSSAKWLEPFGNQIDCFVVELNNTWEAGFVAFRGGKNYAKTWITPPFTPNIGLFVSKNLEPGAKKSSHEKRITNAISDFLKSSDIVYFQLELPTEWLDMQPFIWNKFQVDVRYTYLLAIQRTDAELLQGMDAKLRNMLTKAEKEQWSVSLSKSEAALHTILLPHLEKKKVPHAELAMRLIKNNLHSESVIQVVVQNEVHEEVYTAVFFRNQERIYYLFGAKLDSVSTNVLGPLGLWTAIKGARDLGATYLDFEGSMIPEVEKFFRGYGGSLVPYYSVSGGKGLWPFLFRARYSR